MHYNYSFTMTSSGFHIHEKKILSVILLNYQ
nr:MAG TPA: hypothetical protein [Caudoviricetes sp.]